MAMQEFLASYAVEVDEKGLKRLQEALEENRDLAEAAASAFLSAREALEQLFSEDWGELPALLSGEEKEIILKPDLDLTGPESSMTDFMTRLESLRPKLRVNTTGIKSAVSSAVSSVRSMLASVSITVPVRAKVQLDTSGLPDTGSGSGSGSGSQPEEGKSGTGSSGNSSGDRDTAGEERRQRGILAQNSTETLQAYGNGGRVEKPTLALIGEEGTPEYVIPTEKEDKAVPLLQEVLREISDSARTAVMQGAEEPESNPAGEPEKRPMEPVALDLPEIRIHAQEAEWAEKKPLFPAADQKKHETEWKLPGNLREVLGSFAESLSPEQTRTLQVDIPGETGALGGLTEGLREMTALARSAFLTPSSVKAGDNYRSVEAPVNIQVTSPAASPQEVGRCVYDMAQRHLLRTIQGVFS